MLTYVIRGTNKRITRYEAFLWIANNKEINNSHLTNKETNEYLKNLEDKQKTRGIITVE